MSSINTVTGPNGPVVLAFIGVSKHAEQALKSAGLVVPNAIPAQFLVDTGASGTLIDPSIISPLGISPKGYTAMHTPSTGGTPIMAPIYDVSLIFASTTPQDGVGPLQIPYVRTISAISSSMTGQGIAGLIGRDVLDHCILIYNGMTGSFSLSW